MKTHEFAAHLESLAKLLRELPDIDIDLALAPSAQGLLPGFLPNEKEGNRRARPLPDGVEDKLKGMTPAEIEKYLLSEEESFTAANLIELANRLGLAASKRQSKNALINMLVRHFEASKMHSIMRRP